MLPSAVAALVGGIAVIGLGIAFSGSSPLFILVVQAISMLAIYVPGVMLFDRQTVLAFRQVVTGRAS